MPAEKTKKRGADEALVNARLQQLFPAAAAKAVAKERGEREVAGSFKMLRHDRITVRPQVRRTFPKADIEELRTNIREIRAQGGGIEGSGVLQALLVSPLGNEEGGIAGYRLIAGERRFRATQAEEIAEVPCIVIPEATEPVVRLMQLTENTQRTPPPILDEAVAMRDTMREMGLSLRDIARMLGKSKGYVESRVSLPEMGEDIQEMVSARADTLRHARLIHGVADEALRRSLIAAVRDEEIGEREVRRRIDEAESRKSGGTSEDSGQVPLLSARADSNGKSWSGDGEALEPNGSATSDPLMTALRPAVSFTAEFGRQIGTREMTGDYRQAVQKELERLEREIARIKKKMK